MGEKEIGRIIGQNLKQLRIQHGMTQRDVANILGITFQQIQKYENSTNRLASCRLYRIAEHFAISPLYFYKNVTAEEAQATHDIELS